MRRDAHTGIESPVQRAADWQAVHVRRVYGDVAAEAPAQEKRKSIFRLEEIVAGGAWVSRRRWIVLRRWVALWGRIALRRRIVRRRRRRIAPRWRVGRITL